MTKDFIEDKDVPRKSCRGDYELFVRGMIPGLALRLITEMIENRNAPYPKLPKNRPSPAMQTYTRVRLKTGRFMFCWDY
jgi:hypothetical protein